MNEKKTKRILLVEDDPLISRIYATSLERAGLEVDTLISGAKVVDEIREKDYDLLLLDLVLPEKNGFEVLRDIHRENLGGKVKILVLSNLGQKEKIEKALEMGAGQYLIKAHYTPREVVEKITAILEN